MDRTLSSLFTDAAVRRLQQHSSRIAECLTKLKIEQIWERGSSNENAIGNLMLHLAGNVRQWILSGVAGQPDKRERDLEFSTTGGLPPRELLERLQNTVNEACAVIGALDQAQLAESRTIQGYEISVLEAVFHVVEHYAMHTGQIIYATKMYTQQDLGFYQHLNKGAAATHEEKTP